MQFFYYDSNDFTVGIFQMIYGEESKFFGIWLLFKSKFDC